MFKKIVVGCAEDQAGKDAVVLAAKLAALLDSDLTVVFPYQPMLSLVPADALRSAPAPMSRRLPATSTACASRSITGRPHRGRSTRCTRWRCTSTPS